MSSIITIHDEYNAIGIKNRVITKGIEFDLVNDFVDFRKERFRETSTNKLAVLIEPQISDSYPDLVLVKYNPYNYENYNRNRLQLNNYDYKILYLLNTLGESTSENLVNVTGDSWKSISVSIEKLLDSNFIARKNLTWKIIDRNKLKLKSVETIEAKINKLDKVLEQAILNKKITSNSYVLSNLKEKTCTRSIERFDKMNIGLYTCNGNQYKKLREVSKANDPINMYTIMISEWIGKVINT